MTAVDRETQEAQLKKALVLAAALAGAGFTAWRAIQTQRADADLWSKATDTI